MQKCDLLTATVSTSKISAHFYGWLSLSDEFDKKMLIDILQNKFAEKKNWVSS